MPGAIALNNATLPYILALAYKDYKQALLTDKHLRNGLNIYHGNITCKNVVNEKILNKKPLTKTIDSLGKWLFYLISINVHSLAQQAQLYQ